MRMRTLLIATAAFGALAACSRQPEESAAYDGRSAGGFAANQAALSAGEYDQYAATPAAPPAAPGAGGIPKQGTDADALAQAGTLLAYSYGASLELPARNVRAVMDAHQAACAAAGMAVCQILSASVNEGGRDYVYAYLSLRAEPTWLATFRDGLRGDAEGADGRLTGTTVNAEDLTRVIVDTEARLRAQRTLAERLETLLATQTDDVGDLLSVERELARVLGEIDSAAAQLEVMRRRVEMSTLDLSYSPQPAPLSQNAFAPLGRALNGFFAVFAEAAGMIVSLVAFILPWLVLAIPGFWLLRRWWRGRRARKAAAAAAASA